MRCLKDTPCRGVIEVHRGHATAFAGPLRHGGFEVTGGMRMILVLFLYVEGWPYGHLLKHTPPPPHAQLKNETAAGVGSNSHSSASSAANGAGAAAAGPASTAAGAAAASDGLLPGAPSSDRGYVVYRETAALMEALDTGGAVEDM